MPAIAETEDGDVGATRISLGFGDLQASVGDHIGHFYQTFAECKEILIPFLCEGLKAGDKCEGIPGLPGHSVEWRPAPDRFSPTPCTPEETL